MVTRCGVVGGRGPAMQKVTEGGIARAVRTGAHVNRAYRASPLAHKGLWDREFGAMFLPEPLSPRQTDVVAWLQFALEFAVVCDAGWSLDEAHGNYCVGIYLICYQIPRSVTVGHTFGAAGRRSSILLRHSSASLSSVEASLSSAHMASIESRRLGSTLSFGGAWRGRVWLSELSGMAP